MLLAVLFVATACSSLGAKQAAGYKLKLSDLKTAQGEEHPKYLVMSLKYEPVAELRKNLEAQLGRDLKNRGEAHVTVITPPEFKILQAQLTIEDINSIAKRNAIQSADLQVPCLGRGENAQGLQTYFLVLRSQGLFKIRQEIEQLYFSKQPAENRPEKVFQASHFYPHITVGFTERDLHEEGDGVLKNENSCIAPVSTF